MGCSPVRQAALFSIETIFDREQDDAIAVEVVDDGIANRDFADAVLARRAADDDASPLRTVVCGDAVHQDIAHAGVLFALIVTRPEILVLGSPVTPWTRRLRSVMRGRSPVSPPTKTHTDSRRRCAGLR